VAQAISPIYLNRAALSGVFEHQPERLKYAVLGKVSNSHQSLIPSEK